MSLIAFANAGITAGAPLFQNLDFTLDGNDRLGLVAANGRGKTSLLRVIAGDGELTAGTLTIARGTRIGLVPQEVPAPLLVLTMRDAVIDALPSELRETDAWRADVALDELRTPEELKERRVDALSGGWQRLLLLARTWVGEPDLLLLDEPTNHLDLERILMLEDWLAGAARGTPAIIASHDREFLDRVTSRTLFLRPGNCEAFDMPFSAARAALAEIDMAAARRQEIDYKQARKLRQQAAKLTNIGVNSGSDLLTVKAKQLKERASRIEEAQKQLHKERTGTVRLANSGTHAKVLVTLENAEIVTPVGQKLFRTGKRFIFQGDRIGLLGHNGTGKSQFVQALLRAIIGQEENGLVKPTPSITLGYADQQLAHLPLDRTPLQFIAGSFDIGDQRARAVLADAGFSIEQQALTIARLSLGQRSRLGLLYLRLREPNFYLLDEPTNHVDIPGQEALESEILEHEASCVLVSHDRRFIRNVCNRFWLIEKAKLREIDSAEEYFAQLGA